MEHDYADRAKTLAKIEMAFKERTIGAVTFEFYKRLLLSYSNWASRKISFQELAGQMNVSDLLAAIYSEHIRILRGEKETTHKRRNEILEKLQSIESSINRGTELRRVAQEHHIRTHGSKSIPAVDLQHIARPLSKNEKARDAYNCFRQYVLNLAQELDHLTYFAAHEELVARLISTNGNALVIYGLWHADDLIHRLRKHATVLLIDWSEHFPPTAPKVAYRDTLGQILPDIGQLLG